MQLTRRGCFETNSSSCHSLSVADNPTAYGTIYPTDSEAQKIQIKLSDYEFGWDQDTFSDPMSKLAYLLLCLRDHAPDDEESRERVRQVVLNHTGCEIEIMESGDRWSNGYIDHQSITLPYTDGILQSTGKILDFVFGHGSYIETDNDNH